MVKTNKEVDIVGQVIQGALEVAGLERDSTRADKLAALLVVYNTLQIPPTSVLSLGRPLGEKLLGDSTGRPYDRLLRSDFVTPAGFLKLTGTEHRILSVLVANPNQLVLRSEIQETVFPKKVHTPGGSRRIDVHIARLRAKVGTDSLGRSPVISARGIGYVYQDPEHFLRIVEPPQADKPEMNPHRTRAYRLLINGQIPDLTPAENRLLAELVEKKGFVATIDDLKEALWVGGAVHSPSPRNINIHIFRIIAKLRKLGQAPKIDNVLRRGYRLDDPDHTISWAKVI